MASTLKLKLGSKLLEIVSEKGQLDMMKTFSFWSQLPDKCGACKSGDIALFHKAPKGNDYYGLICLSCGSEYTFHQRKEGGGFYVTKDDRWEKFVPGLSSASPRAIEDDSSIPF